MATINFLYRSTKNKANLHLRLLYRFNEIDYIFGANTKLEVSRDYWKKQHKKKSKDIDITNKQVDINSKLNNLENHVLKSFNSINPDEITKEWLESEINLYYNPPQETDGLPKGLIKYIDYYIEVKKNEVSESTIKKCNVIKQLLIRYESNYKKKLLITDVNTNFKTHFENYCLSNNYAPNTIARAIRFVKTICKHAKSNGLETSYQLDNIKIKYLKVDSIYLTFEELEKIAKNKLTESLENARDWLIISCYTGQRVSDFMKFSNEQIRIENGKSLIEFTQKKTGKLMTVPLHPKVLEILKKRKGEFPYAISAQKYNDYIKDVCEIAEINQLVKGSRLKETEVDSGVYRKEIGMYNKYELVTSHIGRRSFATNFYGQIPTSYLIYVTGHSTEAMFLNYIGKSNKDIAMELTNYF